MSGLLEQFAGFLERRKAAVLVGLLLLYALDATRWAAQQPFWFDELITFHIARLPSIQQIWAALLAAADAQPPLIYLLTRGSQSVFGTGELATRLPSVISFGVMSVCLLALVARRVGFIYGLIAMLFAWVTSAYEFAYEARPYGLMLAFSGLAFLCWQIAAEGGRRRLALAGLSLSLAAAVSSHYYAALVFLPLAVAELVRWRTHKVFDWPVWISFALGACPLLAYLPLIEAVRSSYSGGFWSPTEPIDVLSLYVLLLYPAAVPIMIVVLVLGAVSWKNPSDPQRVQSLAAVFPPYEQALLWMLTLLPVIAVLATLLTTGAFVYRYAIPAMIGICALLGLMVRKFAGARPRYGAVVVLILSVYQGGNRLLMDPSESGGPDSGIRSVAERMITPEVPEGLPIVVTAPHVYLEAVHYAPDAVSARLAYLADPALALEYREANTTEYNLSLLAPWAGLKVFDYQEFVSSHPEFLLYHRPNHRFEWVTSKLADEGRRLTEIGRANDFVVLRCCEGSSASLPNRH